MKTNICEHNNFLHPDLRWKPTSVNTIFLDLKPIFSCKWTSVNVYCVHRLLCTQIFPLLGNISGELILGSQGPATKKGVHTVHCAGISWLLKIGPCGKRCPSGPFMGPLATSASYSQALAAGCPCLRQLCFFPQLLIIPGWLLMISDWLLMISGWLLMIYGWLQKFSSWLLMISGWCLMVSGWLLMVSGGLLMIYGWPKWFLVEF